MQLIRNMSRLFRCRDSMRACKACNTALRARGRREIGRKPSNVDGQGSQLLADLIVQLSATLFVAPLPELSGDWPPEPEPALCVPAQPAPFASVG